MPPPQQDPKSRFPEGWNRASKAKDRRAARVRRLQSPARMTVKTTFGNVLCGLDETHP